MLLLTQFLILDFYDLTHSVPNIEIIRHSTVWKKGCFCEMGKNDMETPEKCLALSTSVDAEKENGELSSETDFNLKLK